jgi:hypothetical protein
MLEDQHIKEKFPLLLVIKGKRERYTLFEGEEFTTDSLKMFIDSIIAGGGRFSKLHEPLASNVFELSDSNGNSAKGTDL